MNLSNRTFKLAFLSAATALSATAVSVASMGAAQAGPLTCQQIQEKVTNHAESFRAGLHAAVGGHSHKLGPLKSLVINSVDSFGDGGGDCKVSAVLQVKLKRKIRRDASGTITMSARLSADETAPGNLAVTLTEIQAENVSLSNTMSIGENAYKLALNFLLPSSRPFQVSL